MMAAAAAPTDWLLIIGGIIVIPILLAIAVLVWFLVMRMKKGR